MNENGMERTIEVNGDASVQVTGCNTITVDVSEKVSVSIDGEPASVENGQAVSSFVAEAAESSVKVKDFAVEAACGKTNELSGTVYADLISNSIDEQNVTFNLEFFDSSKRLVSFSTKQMQLKSGRNEMEWVLVIGTYKISVKKALATKIKSKIKKKH